MFGMKLGWSVTGLMGALACEGRAQDVCRALVMSGGAGNGAWEAGVLWGLMHYGDPVDFEYQVISGVSIGSMNAITLAGWDPKDGVAMSEHLSDLWQELSTTDVWVEWPLGRAMGLYEHGALLNNAPLFDTLRD